MSYSDTAAGLVLDVTDWAPGFAYTFPAVLVKPPEPKPCGWLDV